MQCSLTIKVADKPPLGAMLGVVCCHALCAGSCVLKKAGQSIAKIKKGLTHSAIKPFRCLVAGIGFEPMTFGL